MEAFEASRMEAGSVGSKAIAQDMERWILAQKQKLDRSVCYDSRKLLEPIERSAESAQKGLMKVRARGTKTSREHTDPAAVDEQGQVVS